jgi:cystathionine beta-lyase
MFEETIGPVRLLVEHRRQDGDGGPSLRVVSADAENRELLRFDCFERTPHYHVDPDGRDEFVRLQPGSDPIAFAIEELSSDLEGWLKRAGREIPRPVDRSALTEAFRRTEQAMRNPPLDFDDLDLEALHLRKGEKWGLYPGDVIPAWVADMDYPVAEPIRAVLRRAVETGDIGYPIDPQQTGLRELFCERMETRYGWRVDLDLVDVITDVVQGIYVALEVYSEPGDGVVIQTPIYPPFLGAVAETERRLVENPLREGSDRYALDTDRLREGIDGSTRILLFSNPHNPSGRVFTREELEALAEVALERDLVIVSDEIHQDLVFSGSSHVPIATLGPEVAARTLTLTSATKAFSIAGLRCAIAAFGSRELRDRFHSLPRHILGGIGTLGIEATLAAWRHSDPWLGRALAHMEANRDHLAGFIRERWPAIRHFAPEATYLAWLDCRALDLGSEPARFFLRKGRVALSNGKLFGQPGEGFVRLNFATSRPILDEVLARMDDALAREAATG